MRIWPQMSEVVERKSFMFISMLSLTALMRWKSIGTNAMHSTTASDDTPIAA